MNKKGFTLVEILVAVMILIILVTIAAPMYEKTIEKSRVAEARAILNKLYESKQRTIDSMDLTSYSSGSFGFENLDFALSCTTKYPASGHVTKCRTKDFDYVLWPSTNKDYVCAVRNKGDQKGVNFLYKGNMGTESTPIESIPFVCSNGGVTDGCAMYGLDSSSSSSYCSAIN